MHSIRMKVYCDMCDCDEEVSVLLSFINNFLALSYPEKAVPKGWAWYSSAPGESQLLCKGCKDRWLDRL